MDTTTVDRVEELLSNVCERALAEMPTLEHPALCSANVNVYPLPCSKTKHQQCAYVPSNPFAWPSITELGAPRSRCGLPGVFDPALPPPPTAGFSGCIALWTPLAHNPPEVLGLKPLPDTRRSPHEPATRKPTDAACTRVQPWALPPLLQRVRPNNSRPGLGERSIGLRSERGCEDQ